MKLKIKKLHTDAKLPTRAHSYDAGIDLYTYQTVTINPHETKDVSTGIALEIPENFVGLIWDKSSIGAKGLKTLGGVIDAQYRGEIKILLHNLNDTSYTFEAGHKVAQILIQKVEFPELVEVEKLSDTTRGEGGFGSTGR